MYLNWWAFWLRSAPVRVRYFDDPLLLFAHPLAFCYLIVSQKKFLIGFDLWDKYPLFASQCKDADLSARWRQCAVTFKAQYFNADSPYRYRAPLSYVTRDQDEERREAEEAQRTENNFPGGMMLLAGGNFMKNKYKKYRNRRKTHDLFWKNKPQSFCPLRTDMVERMSSKYSPTAEFLAYDKYLQRLAHTKVCIDFPSNSRVTFRTAEALALGSALVGPPVCNVYPGDFKLEDCMTICREDLSDFLDRVEYYLEHESERKELTDYAMLCWDRFMAPRSLTQYYVDTALNYFELKNMV